LYTVIRGGNTIDFKISHKIKLTTKITVTADWGGWKNQSGDNFFRKGIDGLVRNIALLVGAPPSRVKILGEGSAQKGTFWNEDTTSKDFAEWIWKQNKSMAYSSRDHWMTAPTSRGLVNATAAQINGSALPETAVLGAQGIHVQFLQGFAAERHGQVAAALRRDGSQQWLGHWSKLTEKEQQLILERRAEDELDEQATSQVETILRVQETERQRKLLPPVCNNVTGDCDVSIVVNVDGDDNVPASTGASADAKSMRSAKATEEHAWNTEEGTIEDETDNVLERCRFDSSKQGCVIQSRNHVSLLESADLGNSDNTSEKLQFLQVVVDNVKNMNSPKGWTCDSSLYNDGKCNCDCGIWDPDCDKGADMVPSIVNEDLIELLDKKHVKALLNLVDGDGNSNGVLDGGEVLGLDKRLGQSALIGVAKRIIEAQEMGENKRSLRNGVIRLGNFAMFSATETDACDHLLKNVPLDKKLAVYRPVCVRDSEFTEVDEEPSGRCALLPDMQKGSQCLVPGDGVGVSLSHNPAISSTSNASNATPFVPSPKAVCGLLSLLFSKNQGVGGHRSGVGVTSAKWTDPGAELVVQTGQQEIYIEKKNNPQQLKFYNGNGLSFYAEIRIHTTIIHNMDLLTFRIHDSHWFHHGPYIQIQAVRGSTPDKGGLLLKVGHDRSFRRQLHSKDVVNIGELSKFLFLVSPSGTLEIFKDGKNAGMENIGRPRHNPAKKPFEVLQFGGGHIDGEILDIRVWDRAVLWNEAIAGKTRTGDESSNVDDDTSSTGDLPASCVASQKNTWDFVCDDEVPPELAEAFGFDKVGDPQAEEKFMQRENQGEVTRCLHGTAVKSAVFHGKFGDGLTGEYFKLRQNCHLPGLFGRIPNTVKVDETINFETMTFRSPYNEYAVRWTGKVLLDAGGSYSFKLKSKGGSWLAVSGRLLVENNHHCGHKLRTAEGKVHLSKGAHKIGVLFYNRGPTKTTSGTIVLSYKGPDTNGQWKLIPQDQLGSAPMRLSKLDRPSGESGEKNKTEVKLGYFIYDEKAHIAVMPKGSCDIECRRGKRKAGGAPFKFFCSRRVDVSFVAMVNQGARRAFMWLDDGQVHTWTVGKANVGFVASEASRESLTVKDQMPGHTPESFSLLEQSNNTAAVLALLEETSHQGSGEEFIMQPSEASSDFSVGAGEHTVVIQGRPDDAEAFAMGSIRLVHGADACTFFLEGKDKMPDDC